jgi:hypothetical protein
VPRRLTGETILITTINLPEQTVELLRAYAKYRATNHGERPSVSRVVRLAVDRYLSGAAVSTKDDPK